MTTPHYSDADVDAAIAELDADPGIELPISPEQFPHLSAAQRHRYERALYRAKLHLTRIAESNWFAGQSEAPPTGAWHWPDAPADGEVDGGDQDGGDQDGGDRR